MSGDELKRLRGDEEKSMDEMDEDKEVGSHNEDTKRCELFMTRLKYR